MGRMVGHGSPLNVIVVGAGLAGLAAAVWLARNGHRVSLFEAAPFAGGRCRSWEDPLLGRTIDNGNHLLLHANHHTMQYLDWIHTDHTRGLRTIPSPMILREPKTRAEYHVTSNRPVTGFSLWEQLSALKLLCFANGKTVAQCFDPDSGFYQKIIAPLCVSALNTPPSTASASLFARVLRTFIWHSHPEAEYCLPVHSWGETAIEPALRTLTAQGHAIHYKTALKALEITEGRVSLLRFADCDREVTTDTRVILALPSWNLGMMHPSLAVDLTYHPIVNGHFLLDTTTHTLRRDFVGLVGDHTAHWLFFKDGLVSTTTSAADDLMGLDHDEIAQRLWMDIYETLYTVPKALPPHRIIIEKRATFAATPENEKKRPATRTPCKNLFLAGDYVNTGLPATIESAIYSGFMAAEASSKFPH